MRADICRLTVRSETPRRLPAASSVMPEARSFNNSSSTGLGRVSVALGRSAPRGTAAFHVCSNRVMSEATAPVRRQDYLNGGTDGRIAGHAASGYVALRYDKVVNG